MRADTYFNNNDIRNICRLMNVGIQTTDKLVSTASREAGSQYRKGSAYLYKDEGKLFEIMKLYLDKEFRVHKINSFGELINWYVWSCQEEDEF